MFLFAAADTLQGAAGTASAVTISVWGVNVTVATGVEVFGLLYQGQIPATASVLFTVPAGQAYIIKSININNSTASTVSGVQLFQGGATAANSLIGPLTMAGHYTLTGSENGWAVTDAAGILQVSSVGAGGGTVTSVGLSMPAEFTVAGSPVTGSGTLTAGKANQSANTAWMGPNSGGPAVPSFRVIQSSDLPLATISLPGAVEPDGTTIKITAGVISVAPATGSLSITSAANPATLNATTEGTFDWVCPNSTTSKISTINGLPAKISGLAGDMLSNSFDWVSAGLSTTIFTQVFTHPAVSASNSDTKGGVLSGVVGGQGISCATGSATGYGFVLSAPATPVSRTLRVYSSVFSGTATCTATLSDGSASPVTATIVSAASTVYEGFFTIVFNASTAGQILNIAVQLTTNLGSTPNVKFMAVTMA